MTPSLNLAMASTPVDTSHLPFVMPAKDVFFNSPRKTFAHYFCSFPLSINNQPAATDYYNTQFLNPAGEGGKFKAQGGYLRARPLAVPVNMTSSVVQMNMEREVAMALSRGITGFFFDVLGLADALSPTGHLQVLLKSASMVDFRFQIVPMLDMSSLGATLTVDQAVSILNAIKTFPSLARLPDGRIMMAAYNAQLRNEIWWMQVITALNLEDIAVAFIPVLQGAPADAGALNPISYAVGGWGTAAPGPAAGLQIDVGLAAKVGLEYVLPVLSQQFRPKDSIFWEAVNSTTFRESWLSAINGNTWMVQVVTWNDFSESGQVQPYTDATLDGRIGTGFFDLLAYYATWYATGTVPVLTQDVLYFFHRKAASTAVHLNQPNAFHVVATSGPEIEQIELLSFLTTPGTVKITINGQSFSQAAPSGMSSFMTPLQAGVPTFALQRNGSDVFEFHGPVQIYGPEGLPSGVLDLTYWSGSATKKGITEYQND